MHAPLLCRNGMQVLTALRNLLFAHHLVRGESHSTSLSLLGQFVLPYSSLPLLMFSFAFGYLAFQHLQYMAFDTDISW